jgi:hypothetical protein
MLFSWGFILNPLSLFQYRVLVRSVSAEIGIANTAVLRPLVSVYCSEHLWLSPRNSQVSRIVVLSPLIAQTVALVLCVLDTK